MFDSQKGVKIKPSCNEEIQIEIVIKRKSMFFGSFFLFTPVMCIDHDLIIGPVQYFLEA